VLDVQPKPGARVRLLATGCLPATGARGSGLLPQQGD
jgi:hypothetical protein